MKKLLWCLCLVMATAVYADEKAFVYNEHGKHDPFWPLVSPSGTRITYDDEVLTATDMMLEGIVTDSQGNNVAIINGKIVKAKDQIGSYAIETIANDHVDLVKGQERLTLKLKKGGV
ncbi:MAG: hypothetical protein HY209_02270 [Candidatus Omnitrophica bacterium]|nr:hypothetical protein [Candidatus Omnitrophota bacterium]